MKEPGIEYVGEGIMTKILIMGLPGSGKTTLAANLTAELVFNKVVWLNADAVREQFNDWDFSPEGRMRQAQRMHDLADKELALDRKIVIIDLVAPLPEMRDVISPDFVIWCNTITEGRFEDTNKMFVPPANADIIVTERDADKWTNIILEKLNERKV